jgi:peptidyl-prolyl cis-trans isomerase C
MLKKHSRILYIGLIILMNIVVIYLVVKALRNTVHNKSDVVAYVNNRPIYRAELQSRLEIFLANANMENNITLEQLPEDFLKAIVLDVFIGHKLAILAKREGYDRNKEIKNLVDSYQKKLMREKFITDKIIAKIDDESVQKRYAELHASLQGKEERSVRHILVSSEEEAARVRRTILRTGNFNRTAKEKSLDKSTSDNGGDLGYILREEMVPEFGEIAFLLKKGELSRPVQTQFGWHIIKVDDIREAQALPFEQVKENIKARLQQEVLQNYLRKFTDDAKVELMIRFRGDLQNENLEQKENNGESDYLEDLENKEEFENNYE